MYKSVKCLIEVQYYVLRRWRTAIGSVCEFDILFLG